jgi:hypothetical protein
VESINTMSAADTSTSTTDVPVSSVSANPETAKAETTTGAEGNLNVRAVLEAGIVAGAVFLGLELFTSWLGASTPMGPARATVKGLFDVTAGQMSTSGLMGTLGVHFGLALTTTLVLGRLIHHWRTYVAMIFGGAFGGFLYTANVVLLWNVAPGVSLGGGLAIIANYALFGIVAAAIYKARQHA